MRVACGPFASLQDAAQFKAFSLEKTGKAAAGSGGWKRAAEAPPTQHARAVKAAKLKAANTAFGFVNEVADLATHPALRRISVDTEVGPISLVAPPVIISDGPRALGRVPAIGSHNNQIRAEFAG